MGRVFTDVSKFVNRGVSTYMQNTICVHSWNHNDKSSNLFVLTLENSRTNRSAHSLMVPPCPDFFLRHPSNRTQHFRNPKRKGFNKLPSSVLTNDRKCWYVWFPQQIWFNIYELPLLMLTSLTHYHWGFHQSKHMYRSSKLHALIHSNNDDIVSMPLRFPGRL